MDNFKSKFENEVTELGEERDAAVSNLTEMKRSYEEDFKSYGEVGCIKFELRERGD